LLSSLWEYQKMPSGEDISSIDLDNVDYDDVLHLYRGWRRSETELKEKNKEFDELKEKCDHLQETHVRFRGQIQSLESVKDFTINLQSQLNMMKQENSYLSKENRQLIESKNLADTEFQEMKNMEIERNKVLKDAQIESAMLRERYHEVAVSHKELEKMLSNEIASKGSVETRITSNDEVVDSLRKENNSLRLKLDSTVMRMSQCDQELSHAAQQLSALSQEVARATEIKEQMLTADAEVGVLKGDISRLLRLMDHYPASKNFLDRWYDSDGMSFMGMGEPKGIPKESANMRRNNKGIDYTVLGKIMFCIQSAISL
jgi:chromosome segregation ATPase